MDMVYGALKQAPMAGCKLVNAGYLVNTTQLVDDEQANSSDVRNDE